MLKFIDWNKSSHKIKPNLDYTHPFWLVNPCKICWALSHLVRWRFEEFLKEKFKAICTNR